MLDFPASPTVGQTFTAAGVTWTYDGAKWTLGPSAPNLITVSDTPPPNPSQGALWWESVNGQMYVFYTDANSSQWVPTTNQMGGGYATTAYVDAARLGDNRIINGDMRIDQRNNGASGTAVGYTVDRWQFSASLATKGSWQRPTISSLPGFPYALVFAANSAYSVLAGDYFIFMQPIEADMISDFWWGTPQAQSVTLSFWAYSTLAGAFGGSLRNIAATRTYPFSYTLATNTWTKVAITIPGDTAGTWVMSGNAGGAAVVFGMGVGSTFSGPANAWVATNYMVPTGSASVVGAGNGQQFLVTGVKLEIGSVATPYNRQSLAKSMADCQRYYQVGNLQLQWISSGVGTYTQRLPFAVQMRATPAMVWNAGTTTGGTGSVATSIPNNYQYNCSVTVVAGNGVNITGSFTADAEL